MSKYYKAEDVINAIEDKIAEYIPTLYGRYAEIPLELRMAIEHLPTIEVSEDCISRANLIQDLHKDAERVEMEEFANDTVWRTIGNAPSVISQVPSEDAISRKYINDKIGTYFSERGDFGSLECFWILEAIKHAPSVVPKPKEGEEE